MVYKDCSIVEWQGWAPMTDGTQDSLNLFFACLYQRWKEVEIFGSRNQRIEKKNYLNMPDSVDAK